MFERFPTFEIGEYKLRQIAPAKDAKLFYEYINHPIVNDFIGADNVPKSLEESQRELAYWYSLFALGRSYYWAIANSRDEIIGTAGFNNISTQHLRAEISYDLNPEYWGNGIMTNALFYIIEFALKEIELVRIQATVAQDNARSIKIMENLGFKREGELAKYERLKNKHHDFYMYAITRKV
jgi:[ribosomal protein S5]-alanine N-acetyltransferase